MDEITNDNVSEMTEAVETTETAQPEANAAADECCADTTGATENSEVPADGEATQAEGDTKKRKLHLPPKIQKLVDYINSHEDIRQMVFFVMFSLLCGASQMIVTLALSAGLKLASSLNANFAWFVFKFDTTAEFIGFLVGSIVGQVLTFVLNRKKTFNVPDYVALRAVMYAILAILIIIMQTALGGAITSACYGAVPKEEASEFLKLVFNLTGQLVGGIAAVIVNFLGNKFLVMRDWSKLLKKNTGEGAEAAVAADTVDAVACDIAEKKED
ncbi:MAG: GtrA family protein [Clostridia bacterium]|nr:GtrA family protein [Clostridia bacterium]